MRVVLRILLYCVTIALGGLLLAINRHPELANHIADLAATQQGRLVTAGLACYFLTNPLMLLLRWFQSLRRNREISYLTDGGKISVNLLAIEEALTRAIEGEVEVKKAHVRVFENRVKRSVVIEAVVTLWEVPNVTDRNRFCQRLLRRRFTELMPEQNQVEVNLHLHRLTQRRVDPRPVDLRAARGAEAVPAAEPARPVGAASAINPVAGALVREPDEADLYVGPSYPVGDDDEDELAPPPRRR